MLELKSESIDQKMDGQKSQAKLTRTNSSFLRSSPTVRSSIDSLTSLSDIAPDSETGDIEDQEPHSRPVSLPVRSGSSRVARHVAFFLLSLYTLFVFFNRDDAASSENLLSAIIFAAALLLLLLSKKKVLVIRNLSFFKQMCLGFSCFSSKSRLKQVQWFIGDSESVDLDSNKQCRRKMRTKMIVREGVEVYSNGDFYEGEFHKWRCNGSGVYAYFPNGRYEGDWIDGRYDGYGIESWARGGRYRGQYRQGLRHGHGMYKFFTGDSYAGEWCNGQSHGVGAQTCADGSCYVGEFKCGFKHGLGCYQFRNRDSYAGEYFGDKVHGFGVYHFANGHVYEGSWHEGRKQGYGMYTFRSGETRCGEWDNGNLKIPLNPLSDAVLRVVQAARKTAENAIHLRRVDKQVDKASVAANRAATAARVAAIKAVQNRIDGNICDNNLWY